MRLALVVAPNDPGLWDAAARRASLAWLRAQLARHGYHVVIVGGGQDPRADIEQAFSSASPGDSVLVHVSGRLAGRDSLEFGKAGALPLRVLSDSLAARTPAHASFVLELLHQRGAENPALGAECMAMAVRSLGARERAYSVLAALRPVSAAVEAIAFTRIALPHADDEIAKLTPDALVSMMYERAAGSPESEFVAQSFTVVRGAAEPPDTQPELPVREPLQSHTERSIHSLIAEATEARDWLRALELRVDRLQTLDSPGQKVRELVAIARILQVELGDADGAIERLEQARAIEPARISVLQALRRGYEALGRWGSALEITGVLADLAPSLPERAALRVAQGRLTAQRLGDAEGAIALLEAALEDDPTNSDAAAELAVLRPPSSAPDADTRERLAERMIAEGSDDAALNELEEIAAREPMRAAVYATLFTSHLRAGRTDAALLAAYALQELDAADVDQQVLIDQHRSIGPVRVRASLDAAALKLLRAPGSDEVLETLFTAVARAAIAVRVDELQSARKLVALDAAARLSETSTASIGRSFQWAARILGIDCPDLYLRDDDEVAEGIAAIQARVPSTVLGPSVVSGRSAKDLAFLAGRHLAYYRPEYHALVYYPTREELTNLLFAAVQVAMPDGTSAQGGRVVSELRTRIARQLEGDEREALEAAVSQLDARGGRASVGAWMRSAELTATRVGLLLCGDLATATAVLTIETRTVANVTAEARRRDLIAFCASRAHAELRARYVASGPESVFPSAKSSGSMQAMT